MADWREIPCRTVDGVHIPGCMGCAVYGHRIGCTCTPRSVADRMTKLELRVAELTRLVRNNGGTNQ